MSSKVTFGCGPWASQIINNTNKGRGLLLQKDHQSDLRRGLWVAHSFSWPGDWNQSFQCNGAPIKTEYQGLDELSWLANFYMHCQKVHIWPLLSLCHVLLPVADFNLNALAVLTHNHNSFRWVLWVLLANYWNWGWFGEPLKLAVGVRSKGRLEDSSP